MTIRSPILVGLAAFVLTTCAMALSGAGAPGLAHEAQGPTVRGEAQTLPFACSLHASPMGGGTLLQGRLEAREDFAASYALRIRGAGVSIDQGGDLTLAAGETAVLGEAGVSGPAGGLDASLTVTLGGRSYVCPIVEE